MAPSSLIGLFGEARTGSQLEANGNTMLALCVRRHGKSQHLLHPVTRLGKPCSRSSGRRPDVQSGDLLENVMFCIFIIC